MNKNLKRHLVSAGVTFVGTFIVAFIATVTAEDVTFSKELIFSALSGAIVTGGRAITKIIYEIGTDLIQSGQKIDSGI